MINLLLAVALTSLMYFIFKGFNQFKVQTFQAIALNYVVCVITGIAFSGFEILVNDLSLVPKTYFLFPIGLAISFILGFNLIAYSTQKISVSLSTVASRLSLIIPIIFSVFFSKPNIQQYNNLNILGTLLVFLAIVLISIPSAKEGLKVQKEHLWILPVLFLLTGLIDTTLTFTNELFQTKGIQESLPIMIFSCSALLALTVLLIYKKPFRRNDFLAGVALGIPNYFSVYFLMKALSSFNHDSAFVFSINNISVIALTSFLSITLLKEKISRINVLGLGISIISLIFIIY